MKNGERVLQDVRVGVVNGTLLKLDGYLEGISPINGTPLPRKLNTEKQKQAHDAILRLNKSLHNLIMTADLESVPIGARL